MEVGKCGLCLLPDKELRESHFMPRALYALCRTDEHEPVRFTRELVSPTSRQTKHPLFCGDSEQILSISGENWVLPMLATLGGPFLLRERLLKQKPTYQDSAKALYSSSENSDIDVSKLIHFAIGIFYKAAVHSWVGDESNPSRTKERGRFAFNKKGLVRTFGGSSYIDPVLPIDTDDKGILHD